MRARYLKQTLFALAMASASFAVNAADYVFSNTASMTIVDNSPASVYPSTIAVTGVPGTIDEVTVTLHGLSHTFVGDMNVILVSPTGQSIGLVRRPGRNGSGFGFSSDFSNAEITFSPSAADAFPNVASIPSGTYLPTGVDTTNSYGPAPAGPYGTDMYLLNGSGAAQAGTWSLYISDHAGGDTGHLTGGWSITFRATATCASQGYTGTKLLWCQNICEKGYTGATLQTWIHRWITRYRDLPYCAAEGEPEGPGQT